MQYEHGLRFTDTHVYFWGSYLSNFHPCKVAVGIGGRIWDFPSSEYAFMAIQVAFTVLNDESNVERTLRERKKDGWKLVERSHVKGMTILKFKKIS